MTSWSNNITSARNQKKVNNKIITSSWTNRRF
jgi:hypothetical protein